MGTRWDEKAEMQQRKNASVREARERAALAKLIERSSIGQDAWVECPQHGRQPRDPFARLDRCLLCSAQMTEPSGEQ